MRDDELEAEFEIIQRLKHLSDRFQAACAKKHPMPQKLRDQMRKNLEEVWENRQKKGDRVQRDKEEKERAKEQSNTQKQASTKTQSKSKSHSH